MLIFVDFQVRYHLLFNGSYSGLNFEILQQQLSVSPYRRIWLSKKAIQNSCWDIWGPNTPTISVRHLWQTYPSGRWWQYNSHDAKAAAVCQFHQQQAELRDPSQWHREGHQLFCICLCVGIRWSLTWKVWQMDHFLLHYIQKQCSIKYPNKHPLHVV